MSQAESRGATPKARTRRVPVGDHQPNSGCNYGELAGAGVVGEITTHGKRVYIPAETALTFELERPLVLRPFR